MDLKFLDWSQKLKFGQFQPMGWARHRIFGLDAIDFKALLNRSESTVRL
jgi:hypothetical protein